MAATGYTPIQLYRTATASAAPVAGNLTNGELAINYNAADMAMYAKNSSGSVIRIMNNPAGLQYPTADGTSGQLVTTNGSGVLSFTGTLGSIRIDPRVSSAASASTVTPDVSSYDMYAFTALASGLTINAPIGTPLNGDKLIFRILDNGSTRSLTWNATFTAIGVTIPTATTANKMTYVGCIYNSANTRWDVIAVSTQA